MKLTLSKPLALNQLYATNKWGGKYITAKGKSWKYEFLWKMRLEKVECWDVPVRVTLHLFTCRKQDIDSVWKITLDSLQDANVIKDDFWVFEIHGYKHKCSASEERIEIEIVKI